MPIVVPNLMMIKQPKAMGVSNRETPRESFVEETCNCGRVWRGKPGSRPASGCPDCGEEYERNRQERRDNHFS